MSRVAIVHDWFNCIAGSEKVVREMKRCFPEADVFSLVDHLTTAQRESLGIDRPIQTSFINRLPFQKSFRNYLPLMPLAIEQLDLRDYDLVLSSSHAVAKGCLTTAEQLHITYVHTPIRYAWDMYHQYMAGQKGFLGIKPMVLRAVLHYMRNWDRGTADRPDYYIANSGFVANRIVKTYRAPAKVIYPPVEVDAFRVTEKKDDFFLAAGRLVPYKRFDLVVRAMQQLPNQKLVVIGDGPEMPKLKSLAGPNVQLLGYQDDEVLRDHMQRAKAFVFAAIEDFGIMPVEAQACGTPVVGINRGGVAETVKHMQTGVLFESQDADSIAAAIEAIAELPQGFFDPHAIRTHAESFGCSVFGEKYAAFIADCKSRWATGSDTIQSPLVPAEPQPVETS